VPGARPAARFLSYEYILAAAEHLLQEHLGEIRIPVAIELLVEYHLDIQIKPVPGLKERHGIDGYFDRRRIAVDEAAWKGNTNRYRFTLAHELGHRVLHPELLASATYRTVEGFLRFRNSLPETELRRYEWQANWFAGNILLPTAPLSGLVSAGIQALCQAGQPLDLSELNDCERLAAWIAREAGVSREVVARRATDEGHWVPFRQSTPVHYPT
jgi:hypothetical protein